MKKIEIIAKISDGKRIVERLQRRGVVEIEDISDERLVKVATANSISLFEKNKTRIDNALEILETVSPEKAGLLESFSGRKEIDKRVFGEITEKLEETLKSANEILLASKDSEDRKTENSRITALRDSLKTWQALDIPTNFSGTEQTSAFIGSIPERSGKEDIENALPETACVTVVAEHKAQTDIFVIVLKKDEKECAQKLREMSFSSLAETYEAPPSEQIAIFEEQIKENLKEIEQNTEKIKGFASLREDFKLTSDCLQLHSDKYKAFSRMGFTEKTMIVSGFIPEKKVDAICREFEKKYELAITVTDPAEDEDVPVLLQNSGFSAPVESITEMYAMPNKNDLDPTPVMSFFYYLFFGMMLSDAGYGLLMVIGTTFALKKMHLEEKMRKTMRMFCYCGISTVIWGALFGSWFGDIVPVVAREFFGKEIGSLALWFEPLADPIKLLLFSFGLGICHLFLGLGANFVNLWRQGKRWDAVCEVVPVYITILGVAPIGAGILTTVPPILSTIGGYMAIAGVVLVVLTAGRTSKTFLARIFGGLYGLYNMATGYLSDILSYSRLLALGLATGSIAGVINLIGTMPSNLTVKAIMLTLVFVVGHIANLAINLLGAYVHTDRLQFVELFSKFYEGGGREFQPLTVNTKYYKFKEDIKK